MPSAWRPYAWNTKQARRCSTCSRRTGIPGRDGWWWRQPSRRGIESHCPICHGARSTVAPTIVPMLRLICEQCHKVFRRARPQPFCSSVCAQAYRQANVEFRKKVRQDRSLDSETFVVGLMDRPTRCPHGNCGALLEYEPGFAHCRFGCGRLWPLRGESVAAQRTFELTGGLSQ